jgi:uncharacterized protein (TIGR03083 family)
MGQHVDKVELLRRLDREYHRLHAVIAGLTPKQMQMPGVVEGWSIKDLIAHFIPHEQFALEELRHALRGEPLVVDAGSADTINDRVVAHQRQQSLAEVLAAWEQSFQQVVSAVEQLPDAAFDPAGPVVRTLDDTIDGALANNTYDHYAEHLPAIQAWIARNRT